MRWLGLSPEVVVHFTPADLLDEPALTGEALHQQLFTQGGATRVVEALLARVPDHAVGIGFSAGGTVLWQAAAQGLALSALSCVSSTRLRDVSKIEVPNQVFFGAADPHRPDQNWLDAVPNTCTLFPNGEHAFYAQMDGPEMDLIRTQIFTHRGVQAEFRLS